MDGKLISLRAAQLINPKNVLYVIANLDAVQNTAIASAIIQSVYQNVIVARAAPNQPAEFEQDCEDDLKREQDDGEENRSASSECCLGHVIGRGKVKPKLKR